MADALRAVNLYQKVASSAWTKKFVVDIQPVDEGKSAVAYLAPYVHRVALSDHRIKAVDATSVTYQYKPKKSQRVLSRTVSCETFVKSYAQHILPTGFRKVRYYGWMASNSKTKLEELRMVAWLSVGWGYWLASGARATETAQTIPESLLPSLWRTNASDRDFGSTHSTHVVHKLPSVLGQWIRK